MYTYVLMYMHTYVSKIIKIVLCLHMLNFNTILNLLLLQQMMWEQQDLGCSRIILHVTDKITLGFI